MTTNPKLQAIISLVASIGLILVSLGPAQAQDPGQTPEPVTGLPQPDSNGEYQAGTLLVKIRLGVSKMEVDSMLDQYAARAQDSAYGDGAQLWSVPEGGEMELAERLNADPRVEYAEPNYIYWATLVPDDPRLNDQWAHKLIKSSGAWDITTGSSQTVIAIIDTGIDRNHPDLQGRIIEGYDFVDGDADPEDTSGHGTHVSGIAGAVSNNGQGVAGMDWQARIMPIRVLGDDASGTNWDIGQGIRWAYQNGAKVLNLSLAGPEGANFLRDAVGDANAAGSLVVAAMGNCRTANPPLCPVANPTNYPAAYDTVMAAAATTKTDQQAAYSQYGDHCDVAAPGGELAALGDPDGILSTLPTYDDFYLRSTYGYSTDYDYLYGTSMATAYVSGLAALIWGVNPDLTPDQVRDVITDTADDLGTPGPDDFFGYGRINAQAAMQQVALPEAPTLWQIEKGWFGDYVVEWSSVPGATTYTLQEDDNGSFSSPTVRYAGAQSQFQVTDQEGGTWYYRVRASNNAGQSAWSNIQWVIVIPKVPTLSPIENPDNDGEYEIKWSAVAGATGYKLAEANATNPNDYNIRYVGTETSYQVTGQSAGTWRYWVWAYNLAGDGTWSKSQTTTVDPPSLPAPNLLNIDNQDGDGDYLVKWQGVTGADTYILEQSPNQYFDDPQAIYSGPDLQFAITDQPSRTWYYRVRASGPAGKSPWSDQQSVTVAASVFLPLATLEYSMPLSEGQIVNGDFEAGPKDWTEYSSSGDPLIVNQGFPIDVAPRSGQWAAWLGGRNDDVSYIQQWVTVPSARPYLVYWHWINSQEICGHEYDFGSVLLDGATVDKYDLCWLESTASWKPRAVDLSAYKGQTMLLQIRVETDDARFSELFVDDVSFAPAPALAGGPQAPRQLAGAQLAGAQAGHGRAAARPDAPQPARDQLPTP
jgi:thermitase